LKREKSFTVKREKLVASKKKETKVVYGKKEKTNFNQNRGHSYGN
jgi:hypothetical protein